MIIFDDSDAYLSDQFTANVANGRIVLVAEASDLGYREPRRIYDDAADFGIAVRSRRTGTIVRYYLDEEEMTPDGEDVAGWRFLPIPEDVRRVAACGSTEVLIIND